MAMGSGGMTFRVVTAEETSGHGGNSLGSGGHPPEAEERPRRRALQRRKRRFFKAVESQGNVIERGRPTRRGRGSRFMETLCFRLQDSVREVQSDVDRLRGEIQSSREEFQVAGREVYQRISTQAKLTGMQMLKIEGAIEENRRGRLSAEVGGGWSCDDVVQEQEEQEQIDFSDDASDNCASESDKLHEQESVASVDMASSASMDGAEIEGFDAPERSKLLLWCAREMKEMMRQVMDVQAETINGQFEAQSVGMHDAQTKIDAMEKRWKTSRKLHKECILALEEQVQELQKSNTELKNRSEAMAKNLGQLVGYSAAHEAHVATVKAMHREGPFFCCSLADDYVTGSARSGMDAKRGFQVHECVMGSEHLGKLGGCKWYGEETSYSSKDLFYRADLTPGEDQYWTEWTRAIAKDTFYEAMDSLHLRFIDELFDRAKHQEGEGMEICNKLYGIVQQVLNSVHQFQVRAWVEQMFAGMEGRLRRFKTEILAYRRLQQEEVNLTFWGRGFNRTRELKKIEDSIRDQLAEKIFKTQDMVREWSTSDIGNLLKRVQGLEANRLSDINKFNLRLTELEFSTRGSEGGRLVGLTAQVEELGSAQSTNDARLKKIEQEFHSHKLMQHEDKQYFIKRLEGQLYGQNTSTPTQEAMAQEMARHKRWMSQEMMSIKEKISSLEQRSANSEAVGSGLAEESLQSERPARVNLFQPLLDRQMESESSLTRLLRMQALERRDAETGQADGAGRHGEVVGGGRERGRR